MTEQQKGAIEILRRLQAGLIIVKSETGEYPKVEDIINKIIPEIIKTMKG